MAETAPIPMLLWCPGCGARHVDAGEFASKPHHTHACQTCGLTWRPAVEPTVGVRFLPGFKDQGGEDQGGDPRELLAELLNHEMKRYGRWTQGMRRRVREALGLPTADPPDWVL